MARQIRSKLENCSKRLALKPRKKPTYERIGTGVWLGYRRAKLNGTWVVRCVRAGSEWTKGFADADDYEESNHKTVLTYFEATTYARNLAGAGKDGTATLGDRPVTVGEAVDAYEVHLEKNGRDTKNAQRVRCHLAGAHGLANICVASLVKHDFAAWERSFEGLAAATTNRVNNSLKAALNRAAKHDDRITNTRTWEIGLERLAGADRSRNVILPPDTVCALIRAAYSEIGPEFGLLVEVAAQTGGRFSQLVKLTVGNVQLGSNPQLMIPVSKKGWGRKDTTHRPVPITPDLAHRLLVKDRPSHAPLLMKTVDTPWTAKDRDHFVSFKQVVTHLKDDPGIKTARFEVTMYALRHSSIARQLLDGVNPKIVADNHDTSLEMIQKNYSEFLTDHSDAISRRTLSAFAGNVVSLPSARVG